MLRCRTNPCGGRQHRLGSTGWKRNQADSRWRPLDRREASTARPARVRIRIRKPWVLARRRLFGWKVRLLTVILPRRQKGRDSGPEPVLVAEPRTGTDGRRGCRPIHGTRLADPLRTRSTGTLPGGWGPCGKPRRIQPSLLRSATASSSPSGRLRPVLRSPRRPW
jgi:hypothetical protein